MQSESLTVGSNGKRQGWCFGYLRFMQMKRTSQGRHRCDGCGGFCELLVLNML